MADLVLPSTRVILPFQSLPTQLQSKKATKKPDAPPCLWPTAPSLRPDEWLTHACAAGNEDAQEIAESYRFQMPVTLLSRKDFQNLCARVTFNGAETGDDNRAFNPKRGYIAEHESLPYGHKPEKSTDDGLTDTRLTYETADHEDHPATSRPQPSASWLKVKWTSKKECYAAVEAAAASFFGHDMSGEDFSEILVKFGIWKGVVTIKHNMQRERDEVGYFANGFAVHIMPRVGTWREKGPFAHWLERSYRNWTATQYKKLNNDVRVTTRAPLGHSDEDGTWHDYVFASRERRLKLDSKEVPNVGLIKASEQCTDACDAVAELPLEERALAQLFMQNCTSAEAGNILDISQPTLRKMKAAIGEALWEFRVKGAAA